MAVKIEAYHSPAGDRYKNNELFLLDDEILIRPANATFKISDLVV